MAALGRDNLLSRQAPPANAAEGVERAEELAWAQAHGADYVQGYLIARPNNPPDKPRDLARQLVSQGSEEERGYDEEKY